MQLEDDSEPLTAKPAVESSTEAVPEGDEEPQEEPPVDVDEFKAKRRKKKRSKGVNESN
jgi:hypothetical protein